MSHLERLSFVRAELRREVVADRGRAQVCGQTILRPPSVSISQWCDYWSNCVRRGGLPPDSFSIDAQVLVVFDQVIRRPSRISPSQWYNLWGSAPDWSW